MSEYSDNKDLFLEPKTKQYGSHMVMTNVHKPTKTKYVNIDTKFREDYNYAQAANYNVLLPERITEVKSMRVKSIEIPMTFYNISMALGNNSFKITNLSYTGQPVQVLTIPDGQYTTSTLATQITTVITSASNITDLSFTLVGNQSKFYTNGSSFTIEFDIDSYGGLDRFNFNFKLGWILGFRRPKYGIDINTPNIVSEGFIDVSSPRYLYLAIDEFNKGNQSSFVSPMATSLIHKNIIGRITLDKTAYPFGCILPASDYGGYLLSDTRSYTGKIDLQKLNIQILSENGTVMNFNGADFSFCIEVEHEA
jgi:hypothetical protein